MTGRISAPNLASLFKEAGERWGTYPAFSKRRSDGSFQTVSYETWLERSLALASALIELGIASRDHVAILSDNRLEWILADAAVQFCGAADVPRAADVTEEEIAYILDHADVQVAFVENDAVLAKVASVQRRIPRLRHVILMNAREEGRGRPNHSHIHLHELRDLEIRGEELRQRGDRRAEERIAGIQPEDLFTIIYTSGTTGTPKGVQLTHAGMASQIRNLPFVLTPEDRALSILPIWHSYERVFEVISIACGVHTYYTSLRSLGEDLQGVKPTIMVSAPRLWEGLYQRILSRVEKAPLIRRLLFHAARFTAHEVRTARSFFSGNQIDLGGRGLVTSALLVIRRAGGWLLCFLPSLVLDRLVLSKLRAVVGGEFRGTISGGGALPPHVDAFFNDIGIPVLEGYGLTESCPVLAVRTWGRLVIGTVGPFFPETEIRIVDPVSGTILYPDLTRKDLGRGRRGEIHAKGPQIMKGYYKDPEGTSRVMKEGWLATGDLGVVTFNDCLKIVGRCKETIVLLGGENVEPLPIESKLLESSLIDQCMVVGQDQKHLGVLVVPSLAGFASAGIAESDLPTLERRAVAQEMLRLEIRRLIGEASGFKPFERIAAFKMIEKPFEVGDELTMTFKLRRHVIADKYAIQIGGMFGS
jgi:long-chain acyl-CoA synthetase